VQIILAQNTTNQRPNDKTNPKGRTNQAKGCGAFFFRRYVGNIGN